MAHRPTAMRRWPLAFRQALRIANVVKGVQMLRLNIAGANGHNECLPALAADLVHRQVAVIAASGVPHS